MLNLATVDAPVQSLRRDRSLRDLAIDVSENFKFYFFPNCNTYIYISTRIARAT